MARARQIKPGFFVNEDMVELPFHTRLLFIGLLTMADRRGILEDRPKKIKMSLFPADSFDVDEALTELQNSHFINRYSVKNVKYIHIIEFVKHQNPHKDEKANDMPGPEECEENIPNEPCEHHADTVPAPCEHHADTVPISLVPNNLYLVPSTLDNNTMSSSQAKLDDDSGFDSQMEIATVEEAKNQDDNNMQIDSLDERTKKSKSDKHDVCVDIFSHWQTVMNHQKAKFNDAQKKIIVSALSLKYSPEDLKQAITGCSVTPHNIGQNDTGQRYDGLHICLNPKNIDRFIQNSQINPVAKSSKLAPQGFSKQPGQFNSKTEQSIANSLDWLARTT